MQKSLVNKQVASGHRLSTRLMRSRIVGGCSRRVVSVQATLAARPQGESLLSFREHRNISDLRFCEVTLFPCSTQA